MPYVIHPRSVNAVLTFRDEIGQEWLAGADIGPLCRFGGSSSDVILESLEVEALKDRAIVLAGIKIVDSRPSDEENPSA